MRLDHFIKIDSLMSELNQIETFLSSLEEDKIDMYIKNNDFYINDILKRRKELKDLFNFR